MVDGLGWCYRMAFSYRYVLDRRSSLGRLSSGHLFLRCEYDPVQAYLGVLTIPQAWFMDVLDSTYGGGIWCAIMMMGLNVSGSYTSFSP